MDNWVSIGFGLPEDSFNKFYIGRLTQEHMWSTRRTHPYDVVSGAYINSFQKLYTHWMKIPEETE